MRPDRSLDSHVPPRPARRDGGRHSTQPRTTLVGGADRADSYPAYAGYPDPADVYASYGDAAGGSYPGPAGGSYPGPAGGSYPGPADGSYPGPADGAEDTLVLGRLRGPGEPPPARLPSRRSPAGTAGRIAVTACGVAVVAFAGFRLVPPVMQHLGIGTPAPGPGPCATCLGPIPSSSPLPQAPSATPSTTRARAAPPARRTPAAAVVTAPVTPAPSASASASATVPTSPGAPPGVTYRVTAQAGGGFTSQIIVVNHGTAPVSNWQLVVALPLDSVSAVQNAAYSYDSDVVFATPAPGEPPIAPGGTLVVTIDASGPTVTPADCSFDNVACQ
ncbi:MAG TPA: cellulose binding domain-containing protein [Streptosporangiaceae bacterium]